ncbi:MATE family efflux transporter [Clostridium rectalis]|uniref:tryglysin-associated MATE efflux transporter WgkD n=1 Tax=Clostridium rectalis TaxID=2040295 RepID=UPI000F62C41F|nr:MATE family efflux transporter [Clostridium rectalis]
MTSKFKEHIKNINNIALPLVINMITNLLIGLVDQAMVGRISVFAYAAVGTVSLTLYSISGILGMIAIAFNILGSKIKVLSDDNNTELFNKFTITIALSGFIGIIFYILILVFRVPILKIFFSFDGKILEEASYYLAIYGMSIGLTMILFVFSSLFKIIKKTKYIFYGSLIASLSNLVLDYIFIFGKMGFPEMGVTGAAIASIISLFINVIIYIYILRDTNVFQLKTNIKNIKYYINQLIKTSLPLMGQEFLEGTLFNIVIIGIVSRIGVIETATYTLLFTVINILLMPMHAYSSTSLNLVGEFSTKNMRKEMRTIPLLCLLLTFLFYLVISIIYIIFKTKILGFITNDITVIDFSASYIILAIFAQIFNLPHSVYKYSLQGINKEQWVFIVSLIINIISMIIIICLVFVAKINLSGIYIGIGINYLVLSILFYYKYNKIISTEYDNNLQNIKLN